MLLDLLGPAQLGRIVDSMVPGIIIWDQYLDLVKWLLTQLAEIFNSGGIAIIVFTIFVKTLLLPLTIKSIRSSKAMQELAPKIKEIQKKHGQDRQAASQAQMALYQQYGVNPMAGCLPMLIQMPIFFGVYFGIRDMSNSGIGHWADGFLWLTDLGDPDPLHILPFVAGFFQFVQARMMRPAHQKVTDPQQQMMNTMMTFMPLTVIVFGWSFLSGAVLYWAVQALYSVVQQWLITGWGAIGEWFPWLPELPDHRRLGYAAPRNLDDVVVTSGEKPEPKGRFGKWMNAQMEKAQEAQRHAQQGRADTPDPQARKPKPTTPGSTPPVRRDDYQSRVDAATKYRSKRNGEGGEVIETTARPATPKKRTKNKRRKRIQQ